MSDKAAFTFSLHVTAERIHTHPLIVQNLAGLNGICEAVGLCIPIIVQLQRIRDFSTRVSAHIEVTGTTRHGIVLPEYGSTL
jgi:hypothetical protein